MKQRDFIWLLLGCLLIIFGCNSIDKEPDKLKVIKINSAETSPVKLSDIAVSSEAIIFETSKACMMRAINGLEISKDYLFANDGLNIYQFNRKGKFIRKIGKTGKGPHEFISITCFTIDAQSKKVFIGTLGKILCFDFEGNFIMEIKKYKFFDYLKVLKGQLWAFYSDIVKRDQPPMLYQFHVDIYSLGGNIEDSLVIKTIEMEKETMTYSPHMQYLSENGNKLYLYCPVLVPDPVVRDTLYIFQSNRLMPKVKLDFSDFDTPSGDSKNVFIDCMFRTQRFLVTDYYYKRKKQTFIYDFKNDQKYNLNGGIKDDIHGTGNVSLSPLNLTSSQLYFVKNGYEVEGKIDGVNENSNPVVFLVKLKE